jgi:hypothetical protein
MARTFLRDAARLDRLARELDSLLESLDNSENVPERYDSTLAGELAAADAELVARAKAVVFRLELWARFPASDRERYTRRLEPVPGPRSVA